MIAPTVDPTAEIGSWKYHLLIACEDERANIKDYFIKTFSFWNAFFSLPEIAGIFPYPHGVFAMQLTFVDKCKAF